MALVGLLLANVLWLAFALGGVRLWGEFTALALSVGTLLLLPRWKSGEIEGPASPAIRLLKLPLFWCGLGLYAAFFIQSWNLSWRYVIHHGSPAIMGVDPLVPWLPTGLDTPLEESNPFRCMTYYAIPWLACCTAWAGLATRRAVGWMLHGLALIGVAFAFVALRQHFLDSELILGIFQTARTRVGTDIPFWGTLINPNHGAFFLILANGLCLGLFLSGWHRDLRQFKHRGGAWLLYLGLAFLCSFAVLMAQARGAIGFLVLQWILFVFICTVFFLKRFGLVGLLLPGFLFMVALGIGITFVVNPDVYEQQREEWIRTFDLVENPELEARYYMLQIAGDLLVRKPWYGHGGGSWRYVHLPVLADYPDFHTERISWKRNEVTGKRERQTTVIWFQNAHVDLLEYLVEWGIVGCLFPVLAGLWLLYRGIRSFRGWDVGLATILMSVLVVFLGTIVEFHFRIPLVLLVWCLMFTLTIKLVDLNAGAL